MIARVTRVTNVFPVRHARATNRPRARRMAPRRAAPRRTHATSRHAMHHVRDYDALTTHAHHERICVMCATVCVREVTPPRRPCGGCGAHDRAGRRRERVERDVADPAAPVAPPRGTRERLRRLRRRRVRARARWRHNGIVHVVAAAAAHRVTGGHGNARARRHATASSTRAPPQWR